MAIIELGKNSSNILADEELIRIVRGGPTLREQFQGVVNTIRELGSFFRRKEVNLYEVIGYGHSLGGGDAIETARRSGLAEQSAHTPVFSGFARSMHQRVQALTS